MDDAGEELRPHALQRARPRSTPTTSSNLQVAFTFSTGVNRGQEAAPLVVGDTMYVVTPYPEHPLRARPDQARRAAEVEVRAEARAGRRRASPAATSSTAAPSIADGKIFFNTLDGNTVAVDAETGKEVWKTKVGDINMRRDDDDGAARRRRARCSSATAAASSACAAGSTALDAETGKVVWTAYSTGPDEDVLIGPDFKPFYDSDKGKDLGVTTWPPDAWKIGGGTVWGWISYDPELNLIYLRHRQSRAVEPGAAARRQQVDRRHLRPRPRHRRGALVLPVQPARPASTTTASTRASCSTCRWNGQPRKVLVHPERNGYIYVIDRTTGEVLSAEPFGYDQRRPRAST